MEKVSQKQLAEELAQLTAAVQQLVDDRAATHPQAGPATGWGARTRRHGAHYAPLVILLAVQALVLLLTSADKPGDGQNLNAGSGSMVSQGTGGDGDYALQGSGSGLATGGSAAGGGGGGPGVRGTSGANGASAAGASGAAAASDLQGALAMGAASAGIDPGQPEPWPWTKPWLLEGDRSRCAPGGQIQDDIRDSSVPCMPKFTGANSGASAMGVTADTVTVVFYQGHRTAEWDAFYESVLEESREQEEQYVAAFEKFFNDRFEFYGRKVDLVFVRGECPTSPGDCMRQEARNLVKKYQPFACACYGGSIDFADELMKLGVWHANPTYLGFDASWYSQRRPFGWSPYTDGQLSSHMAAEYWCKKMYGKNATRAGDAAMRLQRRKLGLIGYDNPVYDEIMKLTIDLVTGGMCGSKAPEDKPVVFRIQDTGGDTARQQEQSTAMAAAFKAEGVTTVYSVTAGGTGLALAGFSGESYFPEHLVGFTNFDHDLVTRIAPPEQMRNAFGFGVLKGYRPPEEEEFVKAAKAANPTYEFRCSGCLAHWNTIQPLMLQLQWAGPNLTPHTLERGAHEAPQLGGFRWADDSNTEPWPGWKCCNPYAIQFDFHPGKPGAYTMVKDARHVYWDPAARSTYDNQPGAWLCPEGPHCPRFNVGGWGAGEPAEPDPNAQ